MHQARRGNVLETFADNGGRVFDAMHDDWIAEQLHATFANELGIQNKLFWSTRGTPGGGGPPQPGIATVPEHVEMWRAKLKVRRMDLVMLPAAADPAHLAALKAEKQAGRVRYIVVQVIADQQYTQLEAVMRNEPIDFIGVEYDIGNRARIEDTILPLAMARKIGVMAFLPFGNNGGVSCGSGSNLFGRVRQRCIRSVYVGASPRRSGAPGSRLGSVNGDVGRRIETRPQGRPCPMSEASPCGSPISWRASR
jgi:aryl-alcohol dehydrogenase-like predicted oxidoreductase